MLHPSMMSRISLDLARTPDFSEGISFRRVP